MKEKVVVITGASSGIGKATALEFGRRGAKVAIAARRKALLDEVILKVRERGSDGLAMSLDVTDEKAVQQLADETFNTFGRIDAWVNNAAVTAFGKFEAVPSRIFQRVVEVNFLGCVNGTRAALPYLQKQDRGVLINISSVMGMIGQPYATSYVASKFAIRGFSEALRFEVESSGVRVCVVMPASIDTPIFQQGANYSGRAPKAISPVYSAHEVAEKIVDLVENPKNEVYVGTVAPLIANAHKVLPTLVGETLVAQVRREHFQNKPAAPTEGNLFEPILKTECSQISGGWK